MHLLETYALTTASKINKPFIIKKYFPLPYSKYITIQNSSGMPSKCYSYFQEVVNFIQPFLEKENIKIVQIGSKEDPPLVGTINLNGKCSINQSAYLLSNSLLHIGNDSFAIHMASAFDIPLIGLYSISSPEIAGPFWKNDKQICLVPDGDWKPSFNPNESPKKIDTIKIETIITSIEKILFNTNNINIKTEYIGEKFSHRILEALPDQVIPSNIFENQLLNIRYDYKDNYENLDQIIQNLNIRQCCIITNRPFNIEKLYPLFNNLKLVIYNITDGVDIDFIKKINNFGLNTSILFFKDKNSEEQLTNRKIEMIDLPNHIDEILKVPENIPQIIDNNSIFRTNKILFANNQVYASRAGYIENKPINFNMSNLIIEQPIKNINNLELLKEDFDYSFIYSNKNLTLI